MAWNRIMITTRPCHYPVTTHQKVCLNKHSSWDRSRNNAGTAGVPNGKPTNILLNAIWCQICRKKKSMDPFFVERLRTHLGLPSDRIPSWVQYHLRIPFYPTWSCWYAWALLLQKSHQYQSCILDPRPLRFQPTATGSASLETSLVQTASKPVDTTHDAAVSSSCPLHPLWGDLCVKQSCWKEGKESWRPNPWRLKNADYGWFSQSLKTCAICSTGFYSFAGCIWHFVFTYIYRFVCNAQNALC